MAWIYGEAVKLGDRYIRGTPILSLSLSSLSFVFEVGRQAAGSGQHATDKTAV